jgi:4-hydroxybenzoate polyprenyltransferase
LLLDLSWPARPSARIGGRRLLLALREARPAVQLIFLLRLVSGAVLSGTLTTGRLPGLAAGALIWECAVVFVYLYNGVADVVEDSVNRTGRPIASGELPRASAAVMAFGAGAVAVLGGVVDRPLLPPVLGLLVLGYLYSGPPFRLKRLPGWAFLVAALGGLLTYYAGVAAAGGSSPPVAVLVLAGFMSVWMGAVGTTAKDLSDVPGDAAAGRRSLPIRLGERRVRTGVAVLAPALGVAFVDAAQPTSDGSPCASPPSRVDVDQIDLQHLLGTFVAIDDARNELERYVLDGSTGEVPLEQVRLTEEEISAALEHHTGHLVDVSRWRARLRFNETLG